MAKPGSGAARRLSAQAHDLRAAGMSDEEVAAAQEMLERKLGMRCSGCRRRITIGLKFTSISPRDTQAPVIRMYACNRDDCDFAEQARDGATAIEMIEYAWVDEAGVDAPVVNPPDPVPAISD